MTNTYTNHKGIKAALATPPESGHVMVKDSTTTGLSLRVYSTGLAAFVHRYKFNGQARYFTIPDIELSKGNTEKEVGQAMTAARSIHAAQRAQLKAGIDPAVERDLKAQAIDAMPTIREFATVYIERYAKPRKKSWEADQRYLDVDVIPALGGVALDKVKRAHLIALLDKKQDAGAMVARNRLISLLSKFFAYALERGHIEANPVTGIKRTAEKSKDRVLSEDEIRLLWEWTGTGSKLSPVNRLALRFILATGQRPGEVRQMHASQIQGGLWVMDDTKNGRAHVVPLSEQALQILEEVRPHSSNGLLFPNSKNQVMDESILATCMNRLPWPALPATPHDLRRTATTGISLLGFSRLVQDKVTNHIDNTTGGIYDRNDYMKEKQAALDAWGRKLSGIIGGECGGNVIPLHRTA